MLDPLVGHRLALTATSAAVFFLWRRRPDHGADPRFAAFVRQQSAHQGFASILLVLARRRRREDAIEAEFDDMALNPLALQNAMNPKPIQSRLEGLSGPRKRFLLKLR